VAVAASLARFALAAKDPWRATNLRPTCEVQEQAVADETREVLLCGGKGSGKTLAGALRVLRVASRDAGVRILTVRKAYPDLTATVGEAIAWVLWRLVDPGYPETGATFQSLRQLPPELAQFRLTPSPQLRLVPSEATVYFRHLQDPQGLGGVNRGLVWADEAAELTEGDFRELRARIRQPGVTQQIFLTANPPRVMGHWLEDVFGRPSESRKLYEVSMLTNPHLSREFIESFLELPETDRLNLVEGRLGSVFGEGSAVFPEFRRSLHASQEPLSPWPGRPIVRGWDIATLGKRLACVAISVGPGPRVRVLREWVEQARGIAEFGWQVVSDCFSEWGREWEFEDAIDPAAFATSFTDERSAVDALMEAGVAPAAGTSSRTARREMIGALLTKLVHGEPAMQFDPSCRALVSGLAGGYTHDDIKGPYSDPVDALGYALSLAMAALPGKWRPRAHTLGTYTFGAPRRHGRVFTLVAASSFGRARRRG
jgi:hypothetical protein